MQIKTRTYDIKPDGTAVVAEVTADDSSQQAQRCEAMAAKRPGEIVVGLRYAKGGETQHESERYLSDC